MIAQHHRRERLVELEQVDVGKLHLGALEQLFVTSTGPVSISAGSEPILANARMRARGFSPSPCRAFFDADQHGGGAVDDAGRIAGMMHVLDRLDLGMRLDGDRVEAAHLAHLTKDGLSAASDCMSVVGPHVLVAGRGW